MPRQQIVKPFPRLVIYNGYSLFFKSSQPKFCHSIDKEIEKEGKILESRECIVFFSFLPPLTLHMKIWILLKSKEFRQKYQKVSRTFNMADQYVGAYPLRG